MRLNLIVGVRLKLRNIVKELTPSSGMQSMRYYGGIISTTRKSSMPTYDKRHVGGNSGLIHRDGSLRSGEFSPVPTREVASR